MRTYTRTPVSERFQSFVKKSDGCWTWTGSLTSGGYGTIASETPPRQPLLAHRVSWEIHFGPIPEKAWVLHKCDIRSCVRPDHLFLGDAATNSKDMVAKRRQRIGESHPNAILTTRTVLEIRRQAAAGVMQKDIASALGITRSHVNIIVRRRGWRHV